jgi:hypothetical protein
MRPFNPDTVLAHASVITSVNHQPSAAEAQEKREEAIEEHESETGREKTEVNTGFETQ